MKTSPKASSKKTPTLHHKDITPLLQFLNASPTAWHAVETVKNRLLNEGFTQLFEEELWKINPSSSYFVIRNGSSLCAFTTPKLDPTTAHVVASHTDSPGFKLKPNAEFRKENMLMFGVEVYGGPLITSWLNRDLGIAGRVVYTDAKGLIKEALVRIDESPVVIPQLAIHLDRQVNENGLLLNKQEHLAALAGIFENEKNETKKDASKSNSKFSYLEELLKKKIKYKQLLGSDLYLFPLEPAALIGNNQQMIAGYRIDNLNSVHASLEAFITSRTPAKDHVINMIVMWDNEEIGSETAQGAGSPFLSHVLERITLGLGMDREDYLRLIRQSLCVSVDLSHALHPNYVEKHEPQHRLLMDHGIVVKFNAQHRYASDARSVSTIISLCEKNGVPVQKFATRGDIPSGSTIGPIHANRTGMPTLDIGCAQLSMHSCRELTSCQDYHYMKALLTAFFTT